MAAKALLALGGVSAAGVVAIGGYYSLSSKGVTIKEVLKEKRFISEKDDAQWTAEFQSDAVNIRKSIKELKDVTDDNGGVKLKDWCKSQMELDSNRNSKSLKLVGKYCLIRDLASQLARRGKTLLTSDSPSEDWTNTYKYRKSRNTSRNEVGWNDQWVSDSNTQESTDLERIKTWCLEIRKEDFLASDNGSKYEKLHRWCTKEGKTVD